MYWGKQAVQWTNSPEHAHRRKDDLPKWIEQHAGGNGDG